jgi:hypothetical protein
MRKTCERNNSCQNILPELSIKVTLLDIKHAYQVATALTRKRKEKKYKPLE